MSCQWAETTVHGFFDGELDAVRAAEFEHHLEKCGECRTSLEHIESLRTRLRQADLCERASPQLRAKIREQLGLATAAAKPTAMLWRRSFFMPALAILAVAAAFSSAWFVSPPRRQAGRITAELIDAHVRSLQPGHLTDVESTDQHTVKPWFDGKLDFIPPVSDYSEQGFPLVGGRLDVIDGHNVAALIYSRRKHFINLFVWPARTERLFDNSGSRQGYNWISWRSDDLEYCLVSDVSPVDLGNLKDLIAR